MSNNPLQTPFGPSSTSEEFLARTQDWRRAEAEDGIHATPGAMMGEALSVNGLSRHGHKTRQELEQFGYDLGAFHFTQDCPKHVCVAEECLTTRGNPCKKHCMGCGFAHTGFPTMDSWHACQWTKERRFVSLGFRIQGSGTRKYEKELFISRDILVCKRSPSHKTTTARELKGVREKGSRRLLEDMLWWLPLGIDTMNPREMCPIVECEECFAELYDGGDYRTQVPGALRHHLPLQPTPPAQSL
ncbi:hypothetical protein NEMBOFW57_006518 [Staphylotrichum longicolle]|uniref:Uncharacterized protein n=1 Tax=Staphylotrichum longicolle TaxID=669026 RepID=A0AAD4EX85_9PEZI|nr:hypothetical protein NEMBOFW57_006518 [Staphylotrichum longicolle]